MIDRPVYVDRIMAYVDTPFFKILRGVHRCSRYDLQEKEILKTQEKFYLADTALRYSVLGCSADSVASSLESVIYLELCRRDYTVHVGKTGDGEINFVAVRQNEKLYVQVMQKIESEETKQREYNQLLEIRGNYPKYVLRTDEFAGGSYKSIRMMHVADFLLRQNIEVNTAFHARLCKQADVSSV